MPGISFDRAASYYDATRGYAPGVAERIRDAIVAHTGIDLRSRLLEVGIGTGRIALPFINAGYDYSGVDLARSMLDMLLTKAGPVRRPRLVQADVMQLPFATATFDVVLVVHVLHLVENWQQALHEARRVMRPGGWLLLAYDDAPHARPDEQKGLPAPLQAQEVWTAILTEMGYQKREDELGPRVDDANFIAHLQRLGASTQQIQLADYERPPISARTVFTRYRDRIYSKDWARPDAVHNEAVRRLAHWLDHHCSAPDEQFVVRGRFMALTARWDDGSNG